jgi:hypothetical protein
MKGRSLLSMPAAFLLVGCDASSDDDEAASCRSESHCQKVDGQAVCDEGYAWEDEDDPENYTCVPEDEVRASSGGGDDGDDDDDDDDDGDDDDDDDDDDTGGDDGNGGDGDGSSDDEAGGGSDCTAEVHCFVGDDGYAACDDGYTWEDADDPESYACIPEGGGNDDSPDPDNGGLLDPADYVPSTWLLLDCLVAGWDFWLLIEPAGTASAWLKDGGDLEGTGLRRRRGPGGPTRSSRPSRC